MSCGKKKSEDTEEILKKVAASSEITYDEIQWQAVKTAVSSKVMVLTGGPGTGKTTTTLGIISAYKQAGCQIILAAPTGRAAKRMSEATGMEAKRFTGYWNINLRKAIRKMKNIRWKEMC